MFINVKPLTEPWRFANVPLTESKSTLFTVAFVRDCPDASEYALPVALLKIVPDTVRFVDKPFRVRTSPDVPKKFEFVTDKSVNTELLKVRTLPPAFVAVTFDSVTVEAVLPNVKDMLLD